MTIAFITASSLKQGTDSYEYYVGSTQLEGGERVDLGRWGRQRLEDGEFPH